MRCQIAPSILSLDHSAVKPAVKELIEVGAEIIHFDVMDGQFVPPITFGDGMVKGLRELSPDVVFEAHLMTETPDRHFEAFERAGCNRIIFHYEATQHAHRLAQTLRGMGISPGIAINPGTSAEAIEAVVHVVDMVLVMTVNPGWGGQSFIHSALEKVCALRELRSDLLIEVDGGIDPETLPLARSAGANLFVVGSYLTTPPSVGASLRRMIDLCG